MPSFGERFKNLRERGAYTQEALAAGLDVAQQQITRWENSKNNPDVRNILKIAKFFGCSADYLLGLVDEPNAHVNERELTDEEWQILTLYERDKPDLMTKLALEVKQEIDLLRRRERLSDDESVIAAS